jgi:tetratricopeptide (TPR) repeat protein
MRNFYGCSRKAMFTAFCYLFLACPLLAQTTAEQRLARAYGLEREGDPKQTIVELKALLAEKILDAPSMGKAWNILGLAYEDLGNYTDAQRSYERSTHSLENLPDHIQDYAMALGDFGDLYGVTGQYEPAARLANKAFRLYETMNDHAGMTRASRSLAGTAFTRRKIRDGRKYLERALKEAQLSSNLDGDDRAALASMQGWLAQLEGNPGMSVLHYQQSLDLLIKRHGEEHLSTGWAYMLLGEAQVDAGQPTAALAAMNRGRAILGHTLDSHNPKYLAAELAYSRALDATGAHLEAARIRRDAEHEMKDGLRRQCNNCTISATAFR